MHGIESGMGSRRVGEEILGSADAAAGVLQEIHDSEIGHRVQPEQACRVCFADTYAGVNATVDFGLKIFQDRQALDRVRTEMDRQHLGNQQLQGGQGRALAREHRTPNLSQHVPDSIHAPDAGLKSLVGQGPARERLQCAPHPPQFPLDECHLRACVRDSRPAIPPPPRTIPVRADGESPTKTPGDRGAQAVARSPTGRRTWLPHCRSAARESGSAAG